MLVLVLRTLHYILPTVAILCASAHGAGGDQPTPDVLKVTLNKRLQSLRPTGTTERQVLFQEVRAGTPSGGLHPFQVTALIRDYGPGYPANRHYGETCVGKMDKWKFDLLRDDFGDWQVQGRMTVTDAGQCKANPAEGVSAIPLNTLEGAPAPTGAVPGAAAAKEPARGGKGPSGEWACYGTGSRLMFGFTFQSDGSYLDGDKKRAGTYSYNASAATVSFRGGAMDGQAGKYVKTGSFQLSATVSCEPWR